MFKENADERQVELFLFSDDRELANDWSVTSYGEVLMLSTLHDMFHSFDDSKDEPSCIQNRGAIVTLLSHYMSDRDVYLFLDSTLEWVAPVEEGEE